MRKETNRKTEKKSESVCEKADGEDVLRVIKWKNYLERE